MTWGKGNKEGGKDNQGGGNQGGGNQGGRGQGGKSNGVQGRRKNRNKNKNKGKEDKDKKDETVAAAGVQDNNVKYCFKCGDSQHFVRDCKKTGPFSCSVHPNATSHDRPACYIWCKANSMPVAPRPPSKERKKENSPGTQNDNTNTGSGTQNLVSTDGIDPIDESEIYSDWSDEDMVDGAYGRYAAELTEEDMPVDSEEYLSDD